MSGPWMHETCEENVESHFSSPQGTRPLHWYETCSLFVSCMANSFTFSDTQLNMFFLGSKAGMPPTPPGTPLEECCFPPPNPETTACPVAGCGKQVKRLWNHMEIHRKKGDTLPQQQLHSKRNRWTQEEERVLREEINIIPQQQIPSRKTCQGIIDSRFFSMRSTCMA